MLAPRRCGPGSGGRQAGGVDRRGSIGRWSAGRRRAWPQAVPDGPPVRATGRPASRCPPTRSVAVNFAFSEEQEELRKIVRQFLESKSPEAEVRELMDTDEGYDPAVWSQMGEQLGPAGPHHPRGVRRLGLHATSSSPSCSRRWAAPCCARRTSPRSCSPPTRCCTPATTPPRRSYLPGIAVRRDDRHARLHRAQRQVGRGGHRRPPPPRPATATRSTARRCSCSTATPPT